MLKNKVLELLMSRRFVCCFFVWLFFLSAGCQRVVTNVMINAPNQGRRIKSEVGLGAGPRFWGADHELFVEVGPPDAMLRAWVFEPKGKGGGEGGDDAKPRGTVLVVHGWRNDMVGILHIGKSFAKAGYRSVMVDLRGHGRSTGDYISYGVHESRDLSQLLDALETHDLLEGSLGVWGISMGATTSLKLAAQDERVDAVVAVAPFASLRQVAPSLMRVLLPGYAHGLTHEEHQAMIDTSAKEAGFDPDEAEALRAISSFEAPVLLMHGNWDRVVPYSHGASLYEAGADHTEFVTLKSTGHMMPHHDLDGSMRRRSVEWFDRFLVRGETFKAE